MITNSSVMDVKPASRLDGVSEYFFSKKLREIDQMRASGKEVISLGVGGPDLPPHPSVVEVLYREALKPDTHSYQPNKGTMILRRAYSQWYADKYGVELDPASEILPLIGSKEGIMDIFMAYLDKGDKVLIPNPGYPTYRSAAALSGGVCVDYILREESDWQPDFADIERAGVDGVKIMVVNYPHMPTGALPSEGLFSQIVAFARKHNILVVHDNPYSFIRNPHPASILSVEGAKDVCVELNSLSKSHNMAGWRMGLIAGARERIEDIFRFRSNMDSGIFFPMQAAAVEALKLGSEWSDSLSDTYAERNLTALKIMERLGCSCRSPQAGLFLWGRLPDGCDSILYSDRILNECGVFITPGAIFGSQGERYLRISLCSPVEVLEKALEKIKKVF